MTYRGGKVELFQDQIVRKFGGGKIKTNKRTRNYEKEYEDFHSKPEQVKNRKA